MIQVVVYTWSVHNTRELHCNAFNIFFFTDRFVARLQTISNKNGAAEIVVCTSATSAIPGIIGLVWSLDQCVSWRQRQCCSLYITDSMDALLAVRPSTFEDISHCHRRTLTCRHGL